MSIVCLTCAELCEPMLKTQPPMPVTRESTWLVRARYGSSSLQRSSRGVRGAGAGTGRQWVKKLFADCSSLASVAPVPSSVSSDAEPVSR
eukprot:1529064-Rhodomonas_salina.3